MPGEKANHQFSLFIDKIQKRLSVLRPNCGEVLSCL
jgi:hypothetical protein